MHTAWSPKGSYVVTFHPQGVALWGGDDFVRIQRFNHEGARLVDFSPCERYIVTSTGEEKHHQDDPEVHTAPDSCVFSCPVLADTNSIPFVASFCSA